jgi:hypothetical protein
MAIHDWKDDWNIPIITKEIPKGKEVEVGSSKTPAEDNNVHKNLTQQGKPS